MTMIEGSTKPLHAVLCKRFAYLFIRRPDGNCSSPRKVRGSKVLGLSGPAVIVNEAPDNILRGIISPESSSLPLGTRTLTIFTHQLTIQIIRGTCVPVSVSLRLGKQLNLMHIHMHWSLLINKR